VTPGSRDDASAREVAIRHVLREVHPDRRTAEVLDSAPVPRGTLFGISVPPQGFLSQAKYAVVVVDGDGEVPESAACDRRELRDRLAAARKNG